MVQGTLKKAAKTHKAHTSRKNHTNVKKAKVIKNQKELSSRGGMRDKTRSINRNIEQTLALQTNSSSMAPDLKVVKVDAGFVPRTRSGKVKKIQGGLDRKKPVR
eukprot:GEMP01103241.1.p1 GENE.GEMP01103241.1~~GEMP01103241.1.p1  ORF type:complete len:104 (+),score=23.28 GEMP01103241.1:152-463(+)